MTPEAERLFAFVHREVPPPRAQTLSEHTDLRQDLRMAEEDADDFLARFFQEFDIDPGNFDFSRYFPSEGLSLFGRGSAPVPLTLGMLLRAARDGVWRTTDVEEALRDR